tara:strand:+ start:1200 stop:1406 length:207 start_codon:yes stop_codon:yes gene_type:complete
MKNMIECPYKINIEVDITISRYLSMLFIKLNPENLRDINLIFDIKSVDKRTISIAIIRSSLKKLNVPW